MQGERNKSEQNSLFFHKGFSQQNFLFETEHYDKIK